MQLTIFLCVLCFFNACYLLSLAADTSENNPFEEKTLNGQEIREAALSLRRGGVSAKPRLEHYLLRLVRANSSDSGRSKDSDNCYVACIGAPDIDMCLDTDNWLVNGKPNWDFHWGYRVIFSLFYLILLLYIFVGVSIVSDKFMAGIEVITAKEKTVVVQLETGEVISMQVQVWNETVANLTLMALGSSAPEIMLAIVEVITNDFQAGLLGPGTVIGSAAFNFFVIIAICILVMPKGETKKIEKFGVFIFTSIFSVFAYIWLLLILKAITPCVIDIWEAFLTLFFFPLFVIIAWRIDKREVKKLDKARKLKVEANGGAGQIKSQIEHPEDDSKAFEDKSVSLLQSEVTDRLSDLKIPKQGEDGGSNKLDPISNLSVTTKSRTDALISPGQKFKLTNTRKQEFLYRFQLAKKDNPEASDEELLDGVAHSMLESGRKSKAYYRLVALGANKELHTLNPYRSKQRRTWNFARTRARPTQGSQAGGDNLTLRTGRTQRDFDPHPDYFKVRFDPVEYVVAEDMGSIKLYVVRLLHKNKKVADFHTKVEFKTIEGTAKSPSDYIAKKGILHFEPGDFIKTIEVEIVNDEIFEEEEYFTVLLSNMVNQSEASVVSGGSGVSRSRSTKNKGSTGSNRVRRSTRREDQAASETLPCLLTEDEARVIILDEDHRGIFAFQLEQTEVEEKEGEVILTVKRWKGARGIVEIPFTTDEFTAKPEKDYTHTEGVLRFEDGEVSRQIIIPIVNSREYEKDKMFHVRLSEPKTITTEEERLKNRVLTKQERMIDVKGEARLGQKVSCLVNIVEAKKLKHQIDDLSSRLTAADIIRETSYCDQFREAVTVQGEVDEETGEVKKPSRCDWCCHVFTVLWKILFAFIPPPGMCGGWLCFWGSLLGIGLLTWTIEIVATNLGCAAAIMDIVTAISIVALGTSLPDTFASRAAALADDNADAAIGNVTGSNAVNVFLGIGIAWLMGAIVQNIRGCEFMVEPGDLGFNVVIFTTLVILGMCVVIYRRFSKSIGAELGGPKSSKIVTSIILLMFWVIYLTLATLSAYQVIKPGF